VSLERRTGGSRFLGFARNDNFKSRVGGTALFACGRGRLVGLGHEGAGFVDGALGVVIGLDG